MEWSSDDLWEFTRFQKLIQTWDNMQRHGLVFLGGGRSSFNSSEKKAHSHSQGQKMCSQPGDVTEQSENISSASRAKDSLKHLKATVASLKAMVESLKEDKALLQEDKAFLCEQLQRGKSLH